MAVESGRGQAAQATGGAGAARSAGGEAASDRAAPAFVGRDDALAAVVSAMQQPSLVLVEGEAGIGKTRLLREALASAADRRVLMAACPPLSEPFPLGAIVDGVRRLRPRIGDLELSPLGGALRPLFPEWADQLPPALEGLGDPAETRHRVFGALAELVERLGVEVLVVEDAHWADTATLEWLLTLTASDDLGLSIVVSFRPTDAPEGSLLPRLTSRLPADRERVRIELEALDVAQTRQLVASMFGAEEVSEKFATFLHEHTDGVPLAVEESVRLLRERRDIVPHEGRWTRRLLDELQVPPTVRDSVLERVDRLDDDARQVLRAAAVLAAPADEQLLTALAGLDADAGRSGLAGALACGLLQEADPGRFVFRHVLDAQAVGEAIPVSESRRLHQRAGELLQETDHPPVVRLARHFREAGNTGNWCHYAEASADLALESGDDHTAVTVLYEVLTKAEHLVERRARLARKLGQAASYGAAPLGGLAERVPHVLRSVLAVGEVPEGERGMIRLLLGRVLYEYDHEAAVAEIEAALPDLADKPEQAARAMLHLAIPLTWTWPAARHLVWLERATALLPQIGSDSERLSFIVNRATALLLLGQEEGWQAATDIPRVASSPRDQSSVAHGMLNITEAAIIWGRYAEARSRLAQATELSMTTDAPRRVNTARVAGVFLDWYTGAWDGLAETTAQLAEAEETGPNARLEATIVRGLVEIASGHRSAAEQRLREVGEEFARRGLVEPQAVLQAAALGRLHLADGEPAEALRVTSRVVEMIARKDVWLWVTDIAPVHLDALVADGELDQAADLVRAFADGLVGLDAPAPVPALVVCRAILAEAKGELAEAAGLFADAARAWAALPRPYDELLAWERQGRALLAADRREKALEVLSDTRKRFEELGARWDADRVAQLLRQHGVEVARTWKRGRHGYGDQLSPRELEVVRLVAQGMTNRQVASRLFVSPRTIAAQLSAAMRKLGVSSRTSVAMAAAEAGLLDGYPQDGMTDLP